MEPAKLLPRVGVGHWQGPDETVTVLTRALTRLGCDVVNFAAGASLPPALDVVLTFGPFGSLVPLARQLLAQPPARRPAFILLLSEQFPNPALPEPVRYTLGWLRSGLERLAYRQCAAGQWRPHPLLKWSTSRAYRFRYYGDLHWLQRKGLLSVLAVSSRWTADFLRARGFEPFGPYLSYDPQTTTDLQLDRDISVLWLGQPGSARRRRLLDRLQRELKQRGVNPLMIDGVRHPYVFGKERTVLLNRTKIVLNLLRAPWDDNSMRFVLAALSKALIVTEPTLPHTSFQPGVHLVETPVEQMADTICHYLKHGAARRQITERAYSLVTALPTEKLVAQLLEQALVNRPQVSLRPAVDQA